MADKQILFSAPMIRAILREIEAPGTGKTQTRRLLKRHNLHKPEPHSIQLSGDSLICRWHSGIRHDIPATFAIGDRLWVREAWRIGAWEWSNSHIAVDYCDGPRKEWLHVDDSDMRDRLIDQSRADAKKAGRTLRDSYFEYSWAPGDSPCRWRPSIHMPRWASRLTLHVTDVRVQRLQDISEDDARDEGIEAVYDPSSADGAPAWLDYFDQDRAFGGLGAPRLSFRSLWDSLNADRAPWHSNPWVVAVTFRPVLGNIDRVGVE